MLVYVKHKPRYIFYLAIIFQYGGQLKNFLLKTKRLRILYVIFGF